MSTKDKKTELGDEPVITPVFSINGNLISPCEMYTLPITREDMRPRSEAEPAPKA